MGMAKDYWNKKFEKADHFGSGPTGFAVECLDFFKEKRVRSILDLGCGQGRDSIYFSEQGFDVTALDFSEKALESIKDQRIKKLHADLLGLSEVPSHSFDVAYSNLSFHFFKKEETQQIVDQIFRILKPGGFVCFTSKNEKDKYADPTQKIADQTYLSNGVIRVLLRKEDLEKLLKSFEILVLEEGSHVQSGEEPSCYWKVIARRP